MLFSIPFLMVQNDPITMGIISAFIFHTLFQDPYIQFSFLFLCSICSYHTVQSYLSAGKLNSFCL